MTQPDNSGSDFPADAFEEALDAEMENLWDALENHPAYRPGDFRQLKRGLLRWIEAQDRGLDNAAQEQEHDD